jgi:4'-phosphopantetheinyl transferase
MPVASAYTLDILEPIDLMTGGALRTLAPKQIVLAFAREEEIAAVENQAKYPALLSDEERHRSVGFHFEGDRRVFVAAHALLRLTLSRFALVAPSSWQFRAGEHGRPEIAEPGSRLRFSISHTRGLAACAVVLDRDIGLDVEHLSRDAPIELATSFFAEREARAVENAPSEDRTARFLTCWTLKEAYIKARGLGLSIPLDQFAMYEDSQHGWRIAFEPTLDDDPGRWHFWSWRPGRRHQAALAVAG